MLMFKNLKTFKRKEEYEAFLNLKNSKNKKERTERRNFIAIHYIRWVIKIAKEYVGRGMDFQDLIQAGCLGLFVAIDNFDPEKKYKAGNNYRRHRFTTYSNWWIRQSIQKALVEESNLVKVPPHLLNQLHKILKIAEELGVHPNSEEVGKKLNLSVKQIERILIVTGGTGAISLDTPLKTDERGTSNLHDFLFSKKELDEKLVEEELNEKVRSLIRKLDINEEKLVRMRFCISN